MEIFAKDRLQLYPAVQGPAPVPQRVVAGEAHAAGAVVAEVGAHVGEAAPDQRGQPPRHRALPRVVPAGSDNVFMETSGLAAAKIYVRQELVACCSINGSKMYAKSHIMSDGKSP